MDLRAALAALRAAWWLPVVGLVLGGVLAFAYSARQTPLYVSYTQLFVATTDSQTLDDAFTGSLLAQQRVASYAELLRGEKLAGEVAEELDLVGGAESVLGEIDATSVPETVLIDVYVTDPSPERAREVAEAVGGAFTRMVQDLETPEGADVSPVKVTVVDFPDLPTVPSSPQTERNLVLGLLIGLLIGAGAAIARALLDRSVRDPEEAAALARAPMIGAILRDTELDKRHTFDRSVGNRTAEDYRQVRTNLQFLNVDDPPKVIMVSSALPSEGKTTLVINLALALTDAGQRVVVVEADLRRPKVTRYLGIVGGVGLTNVLAGTAEVAEVIQSYDGRLAVLGAGPTPPNPGELLGSDHMATLAAKLRGEYDYVLFDAPPLLPVADSTGLAANMDGVLLSVRYGTTTKEQLEQAANLLDRVGAKTLGVVLNIVPPKAELAGAYGYSHGYGYDGAKHVAK